MLGKPRLDVQVVPERAAATPARKGDGKGDGKSDGKPQGGAR